VTQLVGEERRVVRLVCQNIGCNIRSSADL
jgi:hypothetical protein